MKENKNVKKKLQEFYLKVSEIAVIRAGIQAIPSIRSPLAELLFSKA